MLKLYKSKSSALKAKAQFKRHNRAVSDVFKHMITDRRVKDKMRYALVLTA